MHKKFLKSLTCCSRVAGSMIINIWVKKNEKWVLEQKVFLFPLPGNTYYKLSKRLMHYSYVQGVPKHMEFKDDLKIKASLQSCIQ